MRVSAVSGDLLVKLGLSAVVLGGVAWVIWRNRELLDKINPASRENVAYQTANQVGGALVTNPDGPGKNADGSWSLGGFIFDILNPGTVDAVRSMSKPANSAEVDPAVIDYQNYSRGA